MARQYLVLACICTALALDTDYLLQNTLIIDHKSEKRQLKLFETFRRSKASSVRRI